MKAVPVTHVVVLLLFAYPSVTDARSATDPAAASGSTVMLLLMVGLLMMVVGRVWTAFLARRLSPESLRECYRRFRVGY
jgi:hypothetical protein